MWKDVSLRTWTRRCSASRSRSTSTGAWPRRTYAAASRTCACSDTTGLLSKDEAETIEKNLREIAEEIKSGEFQPKPRARRRTHEHRIAPHRKCGATGARLHMGRSRNDQVNTTVRLYLRKELLGIWDGLETLITSCSRRPRNTPTSSSRLHPPPAGAARLHGPLLDGARAGLHARRSPPARSLRRGGRIAARLRRARRLHAAARP